LKPIRYGPFKIIDKIGNNVFRLDFPPYMQMYVVVNVENLKLYEPPLIHDQGEHVQIPSIDDFSPDSFLSLPYSRQRGPPTRDGFSVKN
jgi:hypothetical protein